MLFLDEVQSDWNIDIRQKGIRKKRPAVVQNEINRLIDERATLQQNFWKSYNALEFAPSDVRDRTDKKALTEEMLASKKGKQFTKKIDNIETKIAELEEKHPTNPTGEPDMPYKGSKWQDLVMKRMIRWAADNGYDRLGWITGKDTADRYDLSKAVDVIKYIPEQQRLIASRGEYGKQSYERVVDKDQVTPENLESYIGKDLAKKLIESPTESRTVKFDDASSVKKTPEQLADYKEIERLEKERSDLRGVYWGLPGDARVTAEGRAIDDKLDRITRRIYALYTKEYKVTTHSIQGEDLKVGAGWAENLYDKSLPKIARKLTKKKGAVGRVGIYGSSSKLNGALAKNGIKPKYEANYVDISPEVKELAQEGFSYFMPEGRGGAASAPVQTAAPQPPSGVIIPKVKLTEEEKEESRQLLQSLER